MKIFSILISFIILLLSSTAAYSANNSINAAQILWLGCKNFDEVENTILKMKEAGVNTLIVRVFQNKNDRFYPFANPKKETGVYFNTAHAPVVDDILGKLTEITRKKNMKIFAWMTTRDSNWLAENNPDFTDSIYDLKNRNIVKGERLNIFNPKVIEILKNVYKDLARYNIDGILFQDDLVLRHTEGYSNEAVNLFFMNTGLKAEPELMYKGIYLKDGKYFTSSYSPLFWKWSEWKARKLSQTANELMSSVREVNPDLKFAINLYYETVTSPKNALAWLSQDINELINHKFDYYAVMAYHRQMKKELGFSEKKIHEMLNEMTESILRSVGRPDKILMKVQVMDWDTRLSIPEEEIEKAINSIKNGRDINLSFVPVTEETPLNIIEKVFNGNPL